MGTTEAGTRTDLPADAPRSAAPGGPGSCACWLWSSVFAAITWARSRQVDIPFKDPHGKLFRAKLPDTAEMLLVFVAVDVVVRWLRGRAAGATLWSTVEHSLDAVPDRDDPGRASSRTSWSTSAIATSRAGTSSSRPHDPMLLRWDRWLFFGHSPAVLLHDLLGEDLAARLLTDLYESFSWLVTIALVAALAFTPTVRQAYVFVVAAMWAWILGVGSYYLIPSLGPFHAAPAEFAGLTRTSIQTTQDTYVAQRAHLLAHPQAHDAFAQISAFASLHCALTCLIWLMARYYGLRTAVVGRLRVPGRDRARHGLPRVALRGRRRGRGRDRLGGGTAREAHRHGNRSESRRESPPTS